MTSLKIRTAIAVSAALAALSCGASGAGTITLWDFQDHEYDAMLGSYAATPEYAPEVGAGSYTLLGGVVFDPAQEDYADPANPLEINSSSDPIHALSPTLGYGLDTDNYPAQGTKNRMAGVAFSVSTSGYTGISVKFDVRHKKQASRFARFQYTVNGTDWVDGDLYEAANPNEADHWFFHAVDLSGIAGVDDNPLFGFRYVAEYAPGTSAYTASKDGLSYKASNGYRFDMVEVSGEVVPEPASLGVLGAGLASAGLLKRRRG